MSQEPQSQEPRVIYANDGSEFKTEEAAKAAMTRKNLSVNRYIIKPGKTGFIIEEVPENRSITTPTKSQEAPIAKQGPKIIYDQNGDQFKSEDDARAELKRLAEKGEIDPKKYEIKIQPKVNDISTEPRTWLIVAKERYFKTRFHVKADPLSTEKVYLGVNTDTVEIQRNVPVIIPERFLEAADHGFFQKFEVVPGKERKVGYEVIHYPYDNLGEATLEEYLEFKKTKKVRL